MMMLSFDVLIKWNSRPWLGPAVLVGVFCFAGGAEFFVVVVGVCNECVVGAVLDFLDLAGEAVVECCVAAGVVCSVIFA